MLKLPPIPRKVLRTPAKTEIATLKRSINTIPTSRKERKIREKFIPPTVAHLVKREELVSNVRDEAAALKMIKEGKTYEDIAVRFNLPAPKDALKLIKGALERWAPQISKDAATVKEMELQKLDALEALVYKELVVIEVVRMPDGTPAENPDGSPKTVQRVDRSVARFLLEIQERRSKYLGLDAAQKMSVDHQVAIREYVGVSTDDL